MSGPDSIGLMREHLAGLGTALSPAMIQATQRFAAERQAGVDPGVVITRDLAYGPDERHRLDLFAPAAAPAKPVPVLVFVHGGGFVMGDRRIPGTPFYDNVGGFAVQSGYLGVNMTYRLAPAHRWPSGPQDIGAAVRWLHANIGAYGGDPQRIFLMGQSAGAVHVAGYVDDGAGIAGALMISGIYDVSQADPNPFQLAYYGEDRAAWAACSTLGALTQSALPLFFSVSELDPVDFQKQAAALVAACAGVTGRFPPMHFLPGHNHLSPVLTLGTPLGTLGPLIRQFIADVCAPQAS